ncbi:MAG: endonuclease/exonuclease/phosphatase family protein [Gammaproteobacteria bacterium]|nr:endonuclease/exonuclease/phosphatase family protein [Gammaproteobacteria bacterium]
MRWPHLSLVVVMVALAALWPLRQSAELGLHSEQGQSALVDCRHGLPPLSHQPLPLPLTLGVWNGHKLDQPALLTELARLAAKSELLLVQEGRQPDAPALAHWQLAEAWRYGDRGFGVMALSRQPLPQPCVIRTAEPWLRLNKSLLAWRWPLVDGQSLLLVNLHAINFDWRGSSYQHWLDQLGALLARHPGPVVVAGDFNSWGEQRRSLLEDWAKRHQLQEVSFTPDHRRRAFGQPLDGIWLRGLQVSASHSASSSASDHNPLQVTLTLAPAAAE